MTYQPTRAERNAMRQAKREHEEEFTIKRELREIQQAWSLFDPVGPGPDFPAWHDDEDEPPNGVIVAAQRAYGWRVLPLDRILPGFIAGRVFPAWSGFATHGRGHRGAECQGGVPLYSSRSRALRSLRAAFVTQAGRVLAEIDREIGAERALEDKREEADVCRDCAVCNGEGYVDVMVADHAAYCAVCEGSGFVHRGQPGYPCERCGQDTRGAVCVGGARWCRQCGHPGPEAAS